MGLFDLASDLADGLPDLDLRKLRAVVELVWDNRDEFISLLSDLPGLLGNAGEQMQVAGSGAQQAGDLLTGELLELTKAAADTLTATQAQVAAVANVLGDIGKAVDRVPLVGNVAQPVSKGLKAINDVSDDLDKIAGQLRGIGGGLDKVGAGLGVMGRSLDTSGQALAAVGGKRGASGLSGKPSIPAAMTMPASKSPASKSIVPKSLAPKAPAAKSAPAKATAKKAAAKKAAPKKKA